MSCSSFVEELKNFKLKDIKGIKSVVCVAFILIVLNEKVDLKKIIDIFGFIEEKQLTFGIFCCILVLCITNAFVQCNKQRNKTIRAGNSSEELHRKVKMTEENKELKKENKKLKKENKELKKENKTLRNRTSGTGGKSGSNVVPFGERNGFNT